MRTRNLIITLLIIAGITFLLVNPSPTVTNQRTNPNTDSAAQSFQSRLESMSADETLSEKLSQLQTETKLETTDSSSKSVVTGDRITVHYRGWLASDATVFDQSFIRGQPFTFTVGQGVIQGWSLGVLGMKVGEVKRLKIPSDLGYGESGAGESIPANADLIFDVELVKFN
mgnify:CR=1 FL=1